MQKRPEKPGEYYAIRNDAGEVISYALKLSNDGSFRSYRNASKLDKIIDEIKLLPVAFTVSCIFNVAKRGGWEFVGHEQDVSVYNVITNYKARNAAGKMCVYYAVGDEEEFLIDAPDELEGLEIVASWFPGHVLARLEADDDQAFLSSYRLL